MDIQGVKMLVHVGGLCCVGFMNPDVVAGVRRQTSSFY
jgi:hypothetical protein